MITHTHFQLHSIQAGVFTSESKSFSQSKTLSSILSAFPERFDGPIQAIPLPEDAPSDIPRVILESSNKEFKFQAGPSRADSFWISTDNSSGASPYDSIEVVKYFATQDAIKRKIGRLALVINRIAECENNTNDLIEHFCKEEAKIKPFNNSEQFEIHNLKRYPLPEFGYNINSWVKCKAVTLASKNKKIILVEQDINTLLEEMGQRAFDKETVELFFNCARSEADEILKIYFPDEV